jgi:hypothetical protein
MKGMTMNTCCECDTPNIVLCDCGDCDDLPIESKGEMCGNCKEMIMIGEKQ